MIPPLWPGMMITHSPTLNKTSFTKGYNYSGHFARQLFFNTSVGPFISSWHKVLQEFSNYIDLGISFTTYPNIFSLPWMETNFDFFSLLNRCHDDDAHNKIVILIIFWLSIKIWPCGAMKVEKNLNYSPISLPPEVIKYFFAQLLLLFF